MISVPFPNALVFDAVDPDETDRTPMAFPIARSGSIPGVGSGKQLSAAFDLKPGDLGAPLNLGASRVVYQVVSKDEPNPADFDKQTKELTQAVVQNKRTLAFDSFRAALEARLKQEGKLKTYPEKLRGSSELG